MKIEMTRSRVRIDWMPEDFFVPGYAAATPRSDGYVDAWLDETSLQIVNNTSPLDTPIVADGDARFDLTSHAGTPLPTAVIDGRLHWLLAGWETVILPPHVPKE